VCLTAIAPWLRRFDRRTSSGVDLFIANSRNVKERIRRAYAADAVVVPPPVDTDFFTPDFNSQPGDFYLVVSSLEPYKRIDLAIDALGRSGKRLLVAGDGTLAQQLRRSARPSVEFLGRVSDERLRDLFRHSKALIFPGVEDFGIVPVEAQACGKPVICYARGGALETVIDGTTGIYFHEQTQQVLLDAVERCESTEWDARTIRAQSLRFTRSLFHIRMKAILREVAGHSLQFHEHAGGTILHAGA
jgi:glycosyltransferase involved in cell wall biosynthesis